MGRMRGRCGVCPCAGRPTVGPPMRAPAESELVGAWRLRLERVCVAARSAGVAAEGRGAAPLSCAVGLSRPLRHSRSRCGASRLGVCFRLSHAFRGPPGLLCVSACSYNLHVCTVYTVVYRPRVRSELIRCVSRSRLLPPSFAPHVHPVTHALRRPRRQSQPAHAPQSRCQAPNS